MPPKRRSRRGGAGGRRVEMQKLRSQGATLKAQQRRDISAGYSTKTSCISMPPWVYAPKIYRVVRLQNSNQSNNYSFSVKVGDILQNISPAFQLFQIVSVTVYGPYVASAGISI